MIALQSVLVRIAPALKTKTFRGPKLGDYPVKVFCIGTRPGEGDFGARDPYPAEIESKFGDKVLGAASTEHLIKPPDKMDDIIGLAARKCIPCSGNIPLLTDSEINLLRNRAPGWKVVEEEGVKKIRREMKTKGFSQALEIFQRVAVIANEEGHHPDLHLTGYNNVTIELSTHAVNGLTENDFIIAAKINELDLSDLLKRPKKTYWA